MAVLNTNDLFQWGPIDCALQPLHYSAFAGVLYLKKEFGFAWPKTVIVYKGRHGTWFNENSRLIHLGREIVEKLILNKKKCAAVQKLWQQRIKRLLALEKTVEKTRLDKLNDKKFLELYQQFALEYYLYWGVGMLAEPVNFGAEDLLAKELRKTLKEKQFNEVFLTLTTPTKRSFFAEEELELLMIAKKRSWKLLKKHAQNYFWILNSYYETKVLDENYFRKVIEEKWSDPHKVRETLKHLQSYERETAAKKKALLKKYKLNKAVKTYTAIVDKFMSFQDERKKYNWMANHYVDVFCKEFARRKNIEDFQDLKYLTPEEIVRNYVFLNDFITKAQERRKLSVAVYYDTTPACYELFIEEPALQIEQSLFAQNVGGGQEVKGVVVSKPLKQLTGTVKVLTTPAEINKLKQGEILVTCMTSPDYILAMKRAAAIITDVGGMTSHAAIVSRELGIPCIVATKIATKVFKDGDRVEIDLETGVVRKVN